MGNYTSDKTLTLVDGYNTKSQWEAYVEKSVGLYSLPARKKNNEFSWIDEDGLTYDVDHIQFSEKKISIQWILHGIDIDTLNLNIISFRNQFLKSGYRFIKIQNIPKLFMVNIDGEGDSEYLTNRNSNNHQYARITTNLIEPFPTAKQINFDAGQQDNSLEITSDGPITVEWGDGTRNIFCLTSQTESMNHHYPSSGQWSCILHGDLNNLINISV